MPIIEDPNHRAAVIGMTSQALVSFTSYGTEHVQRQQQHGSIVAQWSCLAKIHGGTTER